MFRTACWLGVIVLFIATARLEADESRVKDAVALEAAFQEAIRKAEPSIACVLVSRSEVYQKWFGESPAADDSGLLGGFDAARATFQAPAEDKDQIEQLKTTLRKKFPRQSEDRLVSELKKMFDLGDPAYVPESYGSGIVISNGGLILTNYHVVRDAVKVYVRLPGGGGSYADIHAADPRSDLAVLRLLDTRKINFTPIKRGDGSKLRKGQFVLSLANPFAAGFQDGSPSASWGIISNLRRKTPAPVLAENERSKLTLHHYGILIQTDARLNLGCSGGALIDLKGELVGITTATAALAGAETPGGYALPLDSSVNRIIDVLERGEEVEFAFLGVRFPDAQNRRGEGVQVHVIKGSSASRAGLGQNEEAITILSINGIPIHDHDELFFVLGSLLAGSQARLEVRTRNGVQTVNVTLDKFHFVGKSIVSQRPAPVHGLRVDYPSVLFQRDESPLGISRGVYVRHVQPGSPADLAHLQDAIVTAVNGKDVNTPAEFYRAARTNGPLELSILHRGENRVNRVTLGKNGERGVPTP